MGEVYLGKSKSKSEEIVKGDKLRDLILLVHLNNKYGKGRNEIPALKEILDYSTGGIYNALDYSGYFERKSDGIRLTEKGKGYLDRKILPQYRTFDSLGTFLMVMGFVFFVQWVQWAYIQIPIIIPWYSALILMAGGFFIKFFILRLYYLIIKRTKKMT